MSTLDTLLSIDNNKLNVTNEKINIIRLSEMAGEDVIFEIRPLSIKEIKYDCLTPKELIKKILLPTEISGLYSAFNRAMGFVENGEGNEKTLGEGVN